MRRICVVIGLSIASPALADPAIGQWLTEPDKKGQIASVAVTQCGTAICGKIVKVYNATGHSIPHPNIGKSVFWGMKDTGGGTYKGRAFVPAHDREYAGRMTLQNNQLQVGGCLGPICMSQNWKRIQ